MNLCTCSNVLTSTVSSSSRSLVFQHYSVTKRSTRKIRQDLRLGYVHHGDCSKILPANAVTSPEFAVLPLAGSRGIPTRKLPHDVGSYNGSFRLFVMFTLCGCK